MLVTMSCKAAVKAGTELNHWQMEELIKNGKQQNCPTPALMADRLCILFQKKKSLHSSIGMYRLKSHLLL